MSNDNNNNNNNNNKPEDNSPFNCHFKRLEDFAGYKPGELRRIFAATGEGKSKLDSISEVSEAKTIQLEDSMESWVKAVKELHEAMQKGGSVGIDLSRISNKDKQETMMEEIHNMIDRMYVHYGPRKTTPMIFDTEEAAKAVTLNRQLGTEKRSEAHLIQTILKHNKGGKS